MNNRQNEEQKACNKMLYYPLTHPQKRIWYIEKIYPDTSLHNIGGTIRIKGKVNFKLLERSIKVFVKNNEAVRLRFVEHNGIVKQYIAEYEDVKMDFKDFSLYSNPENEFEKWIQSNALTPFLLDNKNLFCFMLFKVSADLNGYFVKLHHIISDGWSVQIMTNQVCAVYMQLVKEAEQTGDNEKIEFSYLEYIAQEQKYLNSERFLKNRKFWNEKFKELPDNSFYHDTVSTKGNRKTFYLEKEKTARIKEFVADNRASINTFFISLLFIYLFKTNHQPDIVIGTPVLNRTGKKERGIVGMFTSTMPLRLYVNEQSSYKEFLELAAYELRECYVNQKYPYDLLVQDLELNKIGYNNLFDTSLNYYNTKLDNEIDGTPVENVEFYNGNQFYPLQLVIKDWSDPGRLILDFDYKLDLYTGEQIQNIYNCMNNLVDRIINDPSEKIGSMLLLSDLEKNRLLYGFNSTGAEYPGEKTIVQLFEEQAAKTPDNIAVCFENRVLTYRELNAKAGSLAGYLKTKGIAPENIIGLMTRHSFETIIGILGIIKAGCAYLPVDPDYPAERVNYLLEDSGTPLLLTNCNRKDTIRFNGEIVDLDAPGLFDAQYSNANVEIKPDHLAYVIYTSGSTGKPKGVMIEHRQLVNYTWWAKQVYIKHENDAFPLYSSLSFDLTVTSVFTPLICGNKIYIYPGDDREYVLYRILRENKVSIVKLTPSHLLLLKGRDYKNSSVRRLIAGGEDLRADLAESIYDAFGGNIEIYNEYGPTETTVGCMIYKYRYKNDAGVSVPVGVPISNTQIYILDRNLNPVPVGSSGEMYISGDCVARGYLNKPELTALKFVENPFVCNRKMYKTGDLARFVNDGKIEYAGRADFQVKIRGCRIEPAEIEKQLVSHESISEAVVLLHENADNTKYLCAYIKTGESISEQEIRSYLLSLLPEYMVPACFVKMDEFPLTLNGKINREQLPKPAIDGYGKSVRKDHCNMTESVLINVLQDVLNVKHVHIDHNFYHIGGDSIKAIQIASKLNEAGFKIKVKDILSNPIIGAMAACMDSNTKQGQASREICAGIVGATPVSSWFFAQNFENSNHYNQSVLLDLKQDIGNDKLEFFLGELVKHHDALRLNYNPGQGNLFYNNEHINSINRIETHDLSGYPPGQQQTMLKRIGESIKSGFDIEKGILIKACVFDLGCLQKRLLITAHHLVVDGVSWRIILEDLARLFDCMLSGKDFFMPAKTDSFRKWAAVLQEYSTGAVLKEIEFWNSIAEKDFVFPARLKTGSCGSADPATVSAQLSREDTACLLTKAIVSYGTDVQDLLVVSLVTLLSEITQNPGVVIEMEGHGREPVFADMDISRTAGWFTSMYPVAFYVDKDNPGSSIKSVKERLRKIPGKGIGYGVLKYLTNAIDKTEKQYVRFNYLGDFDNSFDNRFFAYADEDCGRDISSANHATCLVGIDVMVLNKNLRINFTYDKNSFSEQTMRDMLDEYRQKLLSVIGHCCNNKSREFTPSDIANIDIPQSEIDELFI